MLRRFAREPGYRGFVYSHGNPTVYRGTIWRHCKLCRSMWWGLGPGARRGKICAIASAFLPVIRKTRRTPFLVRIVKAGFWTSHASACALHEAEAGAIDRQKRRGRPDSCRASRTRARQFSVGWRGEISWVEEKVQGRPQRACGARVVHIEFDGQPAMLFHVRDMSARHAAEWLCASSDIVPLGLGKIRWMA